jgi:hypothetical protein
MKRSRKVTTVKKKALSKKCRSHLSKKIAINIREGIYKSRQQAIAVAYNQIGKLYPKCKQIKKSTKKRDGNKLIKGMKILCDKSMVINRKNQTHLESIVFTRKFFDDFAYTKNAEVIKINKYVFDIARSEEIGSGTYSKVYKLYDENHKVKLALKIETNNYPSEKEISEKLMDYGCHTVREQFIGSKGSQHYYLMNLAEGTLEDLKNRTSDFSDDVKKVLYLTIVEEVRKQVHCLLKLGYCYTDFKLENIFYDCPQNDKKKFKVYLGDLGSAIPNEHNNYVATYPPPDINDETDTKGIFTLSETDKTHVLSWGIGILLFMLMDPDNAHDFIYNAPKLPQELHNNIIERMNTFYGNFYGDYLNYSGVSRRSIIKPLL